MNNAAENQATGTSFEAMIEVGMEIHTFLSNWQHCDCMSTYLARMISHNRSDSVRHSNLFSAAFNELLEIAFRTRLPGGELTCKVSRSGPVERIELIIPCTVEERHFYTEAVRRIERGEGVEDGGRYLSSVSGDLSPSREVVLLELVLDYNAILRLEEVNADAIKLVIDLPLEGLSH